MINFEEKKALVTGGTRGIGRAIAERLNELGAEVIVTGRSEQAPAELGSLGYLGVDFSNKACTLRFCEEVAAMGDLDIVINNAGVTHLPTPTEAVGEEDFDRVMAVNMKSIYLITREVVPLMKARKAGNILNIASTAGLSPRPNLSWYNASKGWVITATKALAVELAPFGVRVNALCPVAGETPLLKSFMGQDTPEMRAKFLSTIPIGRFSTPEDMGNAACYLCSDEASMITGVAMEVDGGRCI